jgi:rRNA maturation endonuclease Nob1
MVKMFVEKDIALLRFQECLDCDRLFKPTYSCKECGCFMKIKVKLQGVSCPLKKW